MTNKQKLNIAIETLKEIALAKGYEDEYLRDWAKEGLEEIGEELPAEYEELYRAELVKCFPELDGV